MNSNLIIVISNIFLFSSAKPNSCVRCAKRKDLIKSLKSEVELKSKEIQTATASSSRLHTDVVRLKETVCNQSREIIELKAKLKVNLMILSS